MIDTFWLGLFLLNQSRHVHRYVMTQELSCYLLRHHDQSEKSQTWATWYILNKIVPDVYNKLISGKYLRRGWISFRRCLNLFINLSQGSNLVLQLLTFLWFLCFGQLVNQFNCTFTVIYLRWTWLWLVLSH